MSIEELKCLIVEASNKGKFVRVIGASSSNATAETVSRRTVTTDTVLVSLSSPAFSNVVIDKDAMMVTVGAGCMTNSNDSTDTLVGHLRQHNLALLNLGSVTTQTIGGFIACGSDGGSLHSSFYDAIVSYKIIDGIGHVHVFSTLDEDTTFFDGCLVSAGLTGIILEVTLAVKPEYWVQGQQVTSLTGESGCPIDVSGRGLVTDQVSLVNWFKDPSHQYSRILFWPQLSLPPRVQIWSAQTHTIDPPASPYADLEPSASKKITALLSWVLWAIDKKDDKLSSLAMKCLEIFMPLGAMHFKDVWWKTLPMDDQIPENVLPNSFLEMYFNLEDAPQVLQALHKIHGEFPETVGNFFIELYPAKASRFWMSPSFQNDKIRLNIAYIHFDAPRPSQVNGATPQHQYKERFEKYLSYFSTNGPTCYSLHLGKWIPNMFHKRVNLSVAYPMYENWKKLREKMDPQQVFLDPYWKAVFG